MSIREGAVGCYTMECMSGRDSEHKRGGSRMLYYRVYVSGRDGEHRRGGSRMLYYGVYVWERR